MGNKSLLFFFFFGEKAFRRLSYIYTSAIFFGDGLANWVTLYIYKYIYIGKRERWGGINFFFYNFFTWAGDEVG